jgi:hypothetical protein
MVQVGFFSQDLPPSQEQKKKAAKTNLPPLVPEHRRHMAPAFLKLNINWDTLILLKYQQRYDGLWLQGVLAHSSYKPY